MPVTQDETTRPAPRSTTEWSTITRATWLPWAIACLAAIVAIALSIWNANLRGDRDEVRERLAAALQENADLRQRANATLYQLTPTEQGPANANATAFFSLSGSGVLSVANMPQPEAGKVYQLWYLAGEVNAPIPGGTFTVDEQGVGFMLIPADVGEFRAIGISLEPEGGSTAPTGPILLSSEVSGARG